jgi:hypothetical protein
MKIFKLKNLIINMRKSKGAVPVAYIIAIILGVLVMGLLGYWLYTSGPKVETFMTESECKSAHMSACAEWTAAGQPKYMRVRMFCTKAMVNRMPADCNEPTNNPPGDKRDNSLCNEEGFDEVNLTVDNGHWWRCKAPGCEERYGITIRGPADC